MEFPGSESPKEHSNEARKGRLTSQHTDPRECHVGYGEERHGFCELPRYAVRIRLHGFRGLGTNGARADSDSANDHTQRASRKTIAPQDVLLALDDVEFPEFKMKLEAELAR